MSFGMPFWEKVFLSSSSTLGLVLLVLWAGAVFLGGCKESQIPAEEISSRMEQALVASAQGDIVVFRDGRIEVVLANFGQGERIILRDGTSQSESNAGILSKSVDRVIKSNNAPSYGYWSQRLVKRLAGLKETDDEQTTQPTTQP